MSRSFTILKKPNLASDVGDEQEVEGAWNLKIVKTALGGFFSFDFHKRGSLEVEEWLESGVGHHIEVYDNTLTLVWEGFVNTVEANIGSLSISRGPFLDIGNKVLTAYSTIEWTNGEPNYGARNFTGWAEDADSQAKYGILEKVISTAGATQTKGEQIRDVAIEEIKDPQTSESENLSGSSIPSVTIHCLGYYHWLNTYTYNSTTTGEQNASDKLEDILGDEPNGIFSTDYSAITENTTQVGAFEDSYRVASTYIKGITALGDTDLERWVFRFGKNRKAIYQPIPGTVEYERSLLDPRQPVRHFVAGREIMPWAVEPGNWVFYNDLLIGKPVATSDFRTDPRYLFIEEATYNEPWSLALSGSRITRLKQLLNQFGVGGFHA